MDYGWHIVPSMSPEEVNTLLKKHYEFPLLRFANIVADVFSKFSFFSTGFDGIKRQTLRKQRDELHQIKTALLKKIDRYHREYFLSRYPDDYATTVIKKIDNDPEKYYGRAYELQRFFETVNFLIGIWNEWFELVDHNKKNPKRKIALPYFGDKLRDISDVRQIFILFSLVMKSPEENQYRSGAFIHWEKVAELIAWFEKKLQKCPYGKRLNLKELSDLQSLKYFCRKKIKKSRIEIEGNVISRYFFTPTTRMLGLDLVKIVFFKDRIKTVFRDNDGYGVLITQLDRARHRMQPPKHFTELALDRDYVLEINDTT